LGLVVLADHTVFALWDLTTPGDPNRSWGVNVTTSAEYDDNFNSVQHNPQAGVRLAEDIKFRASVPLERLFAGLQYDYQINYPEDIHRGGVAQTHILNLSANCSVSPRLGLSLNENYTSTFVPGLVLGPNGVPVTIASAGNYVYDGVVASAYYALTPRWTTSVSGSWDIWRYGQTANATNYNHEDYSMTLSAIYAVDARTTVGVNYQYAQTVYVNPGLDNGLNGYANTAFLSLTRRFNPRLSLTLNGGYTIQDSANGTESTSPSGSGSLVYNYGPSSTISLTIAQSLSEASVGIARGFSAQENTSLALQINHRITVNLHTLADVTYNYSSFTAPLTPTITVSPNDQAITAHIGIGYDFKQWASAVMDYSHTELISPNPTLIAPYTRNVISIGMTLTY
jgi:hypothetical protein